MAQQLEGEVVVDGTSKWWEAQGKAFDKVVVIDNLEFRLCRGPTSPCYVFNDDPAELLIDRFGISFVANAGIKSRAGYAAFNIEALKKIIELSEKLKAYAEAKNEA